MSPYFSGVRLLKGKKYLYKQPNFSRYFILNIKVISSDRSERQNGCTSAFQMNYGLIINMKIELKALHTLFLVLGRFTRNDEHAGY